MGVESIIGVPMRTVASLLVGFLIFGSALVVTGGGEFFMAFATALLGRTRGGPAKVAVLSSGFFGSLSGSVISNVVTTGQITIPTMKRIGYPPHYAGAVEACASTGGALMPPVMGAVAFIMAEFLNVPYSRGDAGGRSCRPCCIYGVLLLQTDHYAAQQRPARLSRPKKSRALARVPAGLALPVQPGAADLHAAGDEAGGAGALHRHRRAVGHVASCSARTRFGLSGLRDLTIDTTRNIINIVGDSGRHRIDRRVAVLYRRGRGVLPRTAAIRAWQRHLLLMFGALTSFILGMGMTSSACYIFLAITLGPALMGGGLNPVASHLFILYWGLISFITPPVALAAIAAASIAGANPWQTGVLAMRLGMVNFVLPFLFVLNPTLILVGAPIDVVHDVATALLAIWLLASGSEGWLYGVGQDRLGPPGPAAGGGVRPAETGAGNRPGRFDYRDRRVWLLPADAPTGDRLGAVRKQPLLVGWLPSRVVAGKGP